MAEFELGEQFVGGIPHTKKMRCLTLAVALAAAACSGCIVVPVRYTACPGASGIVYDAKSWLPVTNAVVTVSSSQGGTDVARSAITGADGGFSIRPVRRWGGYIIPGDFFAGRCQIAIERTGYFNLVRDVDHYAGDRYLTNVSQVFLERVAQ